MDLTVTRTVEGAGRVVLTLSGALDLVSKAELNVAGDEALRSSQCRELVLDLAGIEFLDSSGLGSLIDLRNTAAENGDQRVLVRNPSARAERILSLSGLSATFAP